MACVYLATQTALETSGFVWGDCHYSTGSLCASYLMLPLFSKYRVFCIIKGIMYLCPAICYLDVCLCCFMPLLCFCWWQELLHRTSLESQKLSLMGEVSYLKLKLTDMEGKQGQGADRQHKAEVGVVTQPPIFCFTSRIWFYLHLRG